MKYSKFFQYAYLIFAALFIYDALDKYFNQGIVAYASLLLSAIFSIYVPTATRISAAPELMAS